MLVDIKVTEMYQEVYIKDVEISDYAEIGQIIANTRVSILESFGDNDYAKKSLKEQFKAPKQEKVNASSTEKASSKQIAYLARLYQENGMVLEQEELERVKNMTREEASAYIKTFKE